MGDDFLAAIVIAFVATVLVCTIEVMVKAKTNELGLATGHAGFALFLVISLLGYFTTTVIATATTRAVWPATGPDTTSPSSPPSKTTDLPDANDAVRRAGFPLWVKGCLTGILGVFAFKVFLEQINVTFAGRGVLTIEEWVGKARDTAVATAIARGVAATYDRKTKLAQRIDGKTTLTDPQLNTFVDSVLGPGSAVKLDQHAAAHSLSPRLYKALSLVETDFERASTLA